MKQAPRVIVEDIDTSILVSGGSEPPVHRLQHYQFMTCPTRLRGRYQIDARAKASSSFELPYLLPFRQIVPNVDPAVKGGCSKILSVF